MELYSQRDNEWGNVRIGKTRQVLAKLGCTVTALAMLLSGFHKDTEDPGEAAKIWAFNSKAEVLWTRSKFNGMAFIWRGYAYHRNVINEYAAAADKGVVLEVNYNHWVTVVGIKNGQLVIHDPWDGKPYTAFPSKYRITGYALFKKTKRKGLISDFAEEAIEKAIEKAVAMKWDNPKEVIGDATAEQMLVNIGALTKRRGNVTKERLAVAFDNLGLLD